MALSWSLLSWLHSTSSTSTFNRAAVCVARRACGGKVADVVAAAFANRDDVVDLTGVRTTPDADVVVASEYLEP